MGTTTTPEAMPVELAPHHVGSPETAPLVARFDRLSSIQPIQVEVKRPIRIVIADDETIFRESLCILLQSKERLEIVGACSEADAVLDVLRETKPDVVLLNSSIPQREGTDVLGEIRRSGINVKVIVLSRTVTKEEAVRALRHGVRAIVQKDDHTSSLIESIHRVMQGEYWLGKAVLTKVVEALCSVGEATHEQKNKYGLTPRENEIIAAVLEGYSNPEIAAHLSLSEQTVKHHLSHVFDKLGVYSRVELALFAVNHRINAH